MFELPPLPYEYDALEPALSGDTLQLHHDKHHRAYVDKTNRLATDAGLAGRRLEQVVREARKSGNQALFNNAAQAWNHAFFWECMTPDRSEPSGGLAHAINQAFGSHEGFSKAFTEEGVRHFASGWVWLVAGADGLKVISTHDADDTLVHEGLLPLLVCDLWEHAYYLDYQNDRPVFLKRWLAEVADWEFAARQFAAANGLGEAFRYPTPSTDRTASAEAGDRARSNL